MFFRRRDPWKAYWKKLVIADQKLPELLHSEIHGNFIHQLQHTERVISHLLAKKDKVSQLHADFNQAKQDIDNYQNQMKLMRSHKDIHAKSIAILKLKKKHADSVQRNLRKASGEVSSDINDIQIQAQTQIQRLQNEARLIERRIHLLRDHLIRNQ